MKSFNRLLILLHLHLFLLEVIHDSAKGHITLTFPPARDLAIDFLDNQRTNPPCGMPKGGSQSTLISGSTFNITWRMGLLHQGPYRIELLAQNDALKITDLVSWSESSNASRTTESQEVTLPEGFICSNCTIRLRKKAKEFGDHYIFWSCADIDIVSRTGGVAENCLQNDKNVQSHVGCQCNKGWTGSSCQTKTECESDSDCGNHGHGKCFQIGSPTTRSGQCFCASPYFGESCSKSLQQPFANVMPLPTQETLQISSYKMTNLSNEVTLYHKKIELSNNEDEIEFVLVVNGTSFAAIGWRPSKMQKSCKNHWPKKPSTVRRAKQIVRNKFHRTELLEDSNEDDYTLVDNFVLESVFLQIDPGPQHFLGKEILTHETPNAPFKAMDCTDIVIGTARGNHSRIRDYYTMDRSTPQLDSFWGGEDDIQGATGWETDSKTILVFRKKVKSSDFVDHDLSGNLQMIWSKGQERFESDPLDATFYANDDLKYHGYGSMQRGLTRINLMEQ